MTTAGKSVPGVKTKVEPVENSADLIRGLEVQEEGVEIGKVI